MAGQGLERGKERGKERDMERDGPTSTSSGSFNSEALPPRSTTFQVAQHEPEIDPTWRKREPRKPLPPFHGSF